MSGPYDAVYLSPHLDDAAFSCGGQIAARARRGERVLVVTLFTGDEPPAPYSRLAERLHDLYGLDAEVVEHRRREDLAACAALGAEAHHAGFVDAAYRSHAAGVLYADLASLFGEPRADDRRLGEQLVEHLAALPPSGTLLAPLAVGGHVDHRLTRAAAERAGGELGYYEEMPYVLRWRALGRALGRRRDWAAETVPLAEADLEAKLAACRAYRSQIAPIFGSRRRMERALRRRARRLGGERLWRRRSG